MTSLTESLRLFDHSEREAPSTAPTGTAHATLDRAAALFGGGVPGHYEGYSYPAGGAAPYGLNGAGPYDYGGARSLPYYSQMAIQQPGPRAPQPMDSSMPPEEAPEPANKEFVPELYTSSVMRMATMLGQEPPSGSVPHQRFWRPWLCTTGGRLVSMPHPSGPFAHARALAPTRAAC